MKMINRNETRTPKAGNTTVPVIAAVLLGATLSVGSARVRAEPASYVYMPTMEYGETEVEMSAGQVEDHRREVDGGQEVKLSVGHGFTPWWFSEAELAWSKEVSGDSMKYSRLEWVNTFQLTEPGQYVVDTSLFTELEVQDHNTENPDAFEIGPMFQKELGATVNNLNLVFVRQYESNSDHHVMMEYAWQTRIKGEPLLEYGFQAMGSLGRWDDTARLEQQEHKIGPALFGETRMGNNKLKYNGALLFGATDNTEDYTLRFTVEYEMR